MSIKADSDVMNKVVLAQDRVWEIICGLRRALDEAEEKRIKEPKERKLRVPKERKKRQTLSDRKKTTIRGKAEKEEQPKSRPSVEEDKEAVKKQGTSNDITNRNKRRKEKGYYIW